VAKLFTKIDNDGGTRASIVVSSRPVMQKV
jgi:hypothetical protein